MIILSRILILKLKSWELKLSSHFQKYIFEVTCLRSGKDGSKGTTYMYLQHPQHFIQRATSSNTVKLNG